MVKNTQFHKSSTLNAEEVDQFDKIADSWWDETGPFKPLHQMNLCRLKFIKEHLLRHFSLDPRNKSEDDSWEFEDGMKKSCNKKETLKGSASFNKKEMLKGSSSFSSSSHVASSSHALSSSRPSLSSSDLFRGSKDPLKNLKILDIGCGGGLLSEPFARLGTTVTGIDASPVAIETAQNHAKENDLNINYHCTTVENFESDKFDVILALEIIEHVDNPSLFIQNCARLLKPNGLLFLSTLNRTWKSYLGAIVGAEYLLRWLPVGTHDWSKFKEPSELAYLLREHGLQFSDLKGMSYHPLNQEWSLTPSLGINYIGCANFI